MTQLLKEVRDPVHGFVYLNETEMKIVGTAPFQRLRYIHQLALTYLVYPGAEHSRFPHSLGVMEFSTQIFNVLMMKHQRELRWSDPRVRRNRQLLRLAALLHDTGHAPFSHASEDLLDGVRHEEISREIMVSDPIASLIEEFKKEHGITANEVAAFFSATNLNPDIVFLKQIFSGEVDADKMDYLYRDSLFTGVHYGRFDYKRLIQSLCLIKDPETTNLIMAIEHGGLHALEAMVLARYFMFTQVYFHKIRRAYDHHLQDFLKEHVGKYPRTLKKYLHCDDNYIYELLRTYRKNDNACRILARTPFKKAFETPEHINEEELTRFNWLRERLDNDFKQTELFYDAASKSPHNFEQIGTYVISPSTGKPNLVQNESGIIKSLKKIEQHRMFCREEDKKKVETFCREFWSDNSRHKVKKG
jgi:HD superfamily phosphohydrolase